jgi:putative transposase
MEIIDRLYLAHPEDGSRMMVKVLARMGRVVNRKWVQRLMNLMGIRSLAPQKKTTIPHPEHVKYPYRLRALNIDHPNHVWCADITYVQFTATAFIKVLCDAKVTISMDGVGRAIDNVFIERLWRTIKYDHIYLNPAESGNVLRDGLETFIEYYDEDRPHSALADATPDEVYYRSRLEQRAA